MNFLKNITINDRKACYWESNTVPLDDKKPIIVFLHGFPGNHLGLVDLAGILGQKYRVIILDLPGCGQSDPLQEKHTLESYSQWLFVFLETLSVKKAYIAGHSFGSRVALLFAVRHPGKVEGLALITPVLKIDSFIACLGVFYNGILHLLPSRLQKVWLSNGLYRKIRCAIIIKSTDGKKRRQIAERDRQEMKNLNPRIAVELLNNFYGFNLVPLGDKVKAKSLIIASDSDEIVSLTSIQSLSKRLDDVRVEVMKDSGHLVPLEKPSQVADCIKHWIEEKNNI